MANTNLDMSGEEAGEESTLARLASSLWMADASEVGLAAEPATERTRQRKLQQKQHCLLSTPIIRQERFKVKIKNRKLFVPKECMCKLLQFETVSKLLCVLLLYT